MGTGHGQGTTGLFDASQQLQLVWSLLSFTVPKKNFSEQLWELPPTSLGVGLRDGSLRGDLGAKQTLLPASFSMW